MQLLDIIEKKKQNKKLTEEEIKFFVNGFTNNQIPDYQASAFLMSIWFNKMTKKETFFLTKAMLESGKIIEFPDIKGLKIDKHSTGGVGDKVSLIISPILASLNINVAKMSGGSLGHTGGTTDKLASIGVNTNISDQKAKELLSQFKMFIMSQTDDIVPADKLIYTLRNATATVDCLALVASSICSKKLALATDYIFIDIKYGEGAFCETYAKAKNLARTMKYVFKKFNRKSMIHITNMTQPLGRAIGNGIEIKSALDFLSGHPESHDLESLIHNFVSDILTFTKTSKKKNSIEKIKSVVNSGDAKKLFLNWAVSQGSSPAIFDNHSYFNPLHKHEIKSEKQGSLTYYSTKELGNIANALGAGRFSKADSIDYHAGIYLNKIHGEVVEKDMVIATLYSSKEIQPEIIKRFLKNVQIKKRPLKRIKMIKKVYSNN